MLCTSMCTPASSNIAEEGMCDYFHLHCQAGGWDHNDIGCTIFTDGGCILPDNDSSDAPPWLVFGGWAITGID